MEEHNDKDTFFLHIPVTESLLIKSEGEEDAKGRRLIKGFASTEALDKDREQVLQKGIDFSPLARDGFINWDHLYEEVVPGVQVPFIIGHPVQVEMLAKGLFVEGELLQGTPEEIAVSPRLRLASEAWLLQNKLQKSGQRSLAWSVEGGVRERRGNKVVRSVVKNLALTHKPVNPECTVESFAKSLCCGRCSPDHPQYNPAHSCGNKAIDPGPLPALTKAVEGMNTDTAGALLRENLDRRLTRVLYGPSDCGCFDGQTGRFNGGLKKAVEHMTGCLGHRQDETIAFLRKVLHGAEKNGELATLVKTAGITR